MQEHRVMARLVMYEREQTGVEIHHLDAHSVSFVLCGRHDGRITTVIVRRSLLAKSITVHT